MGKFAIIGDVHGCLGPLEALVEKLALSARDHLVFVGDLLDKGPDSAGVVRFIRGLQKTASFEVTVVEGNHEDRHRRYHINRTHRPGVAYAMAASAWDLPSLDMQLSTADRAFLSKAVPFVRIETWNVLVVHGGIPGDMEQFPTTPQEADALTGKARGAFRKVLRTRYLDARTGGFQAFGSERPGDVFWAERYDGRFGHVVFGHQPFWEGPACFPHATGVDTAAVYGGALTALLLPETPGAAPRFISVPGVPHRQFNPRHQPLHPGGAIALTQREG